MLAQRTADMAVQEAREQAARILAGAEQQAQAILSDAEERGRRTIEDTTAECRAELSRLESARAQAQQDVDSLNRWLGEHKAHLQEALSEAMAAVDRAGVLWPAPSTRPVDVPGVPSPARLAPTPPPPAPAPPPPPEPDVADPDTAMWSPSDDDRFEALGASGSVGVPRPDVPRHLWKAATKLDTAPWGSDPIDGLRRPGARRLLR